MSDDLTERALKWLDDAGMTETSERGEEDVRSLAALLRAVRHEAIEECARECEANDDVDGGEETAVMAYAARQIRRLKGGG